MATTASASLRSMHAACPNRNTPVHHRQRLQNPRPCTKSCCTSGSQLSTPIAPDHAFSFVAGSTFLGQRGGLWTQPQHRRQQALRLVSRTVRAAGKSVLIVNTNSGGHAVIGFYLAKALWAAGHTVTIFTVGEESSDKMKKPPFNKFHTLRDLGIATVWGQPAAISEKGLPSFDVVIDNNGKDLDAVRPVAEWAKAAGTQQFLFVSSAGIYKTSNELPHVEGDAVKADAGHVVVEQFLTGFGFPSGAAFFRPQYLTAAGSNKDCEEWFFDRIARDRPVPIPAPGIQFCNIGHAEDLAAMITLAVDKPTAAANQAFNCVSERAVTFDGLVRMCAKAAGKDPSTVKIVHYDPKAVGVDAKKAFPFRNMHFYAEPRAAKELLGWAPIHPLQETLNSRYKDYEAINRHTKDISFSIDDQILEAVKDKAKALA